MKKKDNIANIFNEIMSNEKYIDYLVSDIKNVRTSVELYLASMDKDRTFEDTIKLGDIMEEADSIVKAIQSF